MDKLILALNLTVCIATFFAGGVALRKIRRTVLEFRPAQALRQLETDQIELSERLDSVAASVKRLHSRAGMREVRERLTETRPGDRPDPAKDPEGWRRWAATQSPLRSVGK